MMGILYQCHETIYFFIIFLRNESTPNDTQIIEIMNINNINSVNMESVYTE